MILDAAVGTGLVGSELVALGYQHLVGLDIFAGMLDQARKLGIYDELHRMTLGETLSLDSNRFDAVISVGTFTDGHAPATGFRELVRITKPGGCIVAAIRQDIMDPHGFDDVFATLTDTGQWTLVAQTDPESAMPKLEPDLLVQTWCFEVR